MKTAEQTNDPQVGQVETVSGESPAAAYQLAAQVTALKAQLEAAQSQVAHLQDALECIERAVDFVPKDEPLSLWVKRVVEERDAAQKSCAEMREVIQAWVPACHAKHALSTGCGKDYVSKEQVKPLASAIRLFVEWCKTPEGMVTPEVIEAQHEALTHAEQIGIE